MAFFDQGTPVFNSPIAGFGGSFWEFTMPSEPPDANAPGAGDNMNSNDLGAGAGGVGQEGGPGEAATIDLTYEKSETPLTLGLDTESQIDVTDITEIVVTQQVKLINGKGGGGGDRTNTGPSGFYIGR
jgi:hypothetical protein